MDARDANDLAQALFLRVASQVGVITQNLDGDQWEELLCSGTELSDEGCKALVARAKHLGTRCYLAAQSFLATMRSPRTRPEPQQRARAAEEIRYRCPNCGSGEVELCFPVWVPANELDNRELWDLDAEASPEKDGDKGWCIQCQTHVLVGVSQKGAPHGP